MTVGQRIRKQRLDYGRSLRDVAADAELDRGHLSRIEHDLVSPTARTLLKIAGALGCSVGVLVRHDPGGQPDLEQAPERGAPRQPSVARHAAPVAEPGPPKKGAEGSAATGAVREPQPSIIPSNVPDLRTEG